MSRYFYTSKPSIAPQFNGTELKGLSSVPYNLNKFYTGREEQLLSLRQLLIQSKIVAITGLGGMGKTQLAIRYIDEFNKDYKYVFWANAEDSTSLKFSYLQIANLLNVPKEILTNQEEAILAVKSWMLMNDQWLLVIDNANELNLIRNFILGKKNGHIIITTQSHTANDIAQSVDIRKMEIRTSATFLLKYVNIISSDENLEKVSTIDKKAAEEISDLLQGLPLALDQAGAFIKETPSSLNEYLDLYKQEEQAKELRATRGKLAADHLDSVTITFSLAFKKISANPIAANILRACSFLASEAIPEELFLKGATELGAEIGIIKTQPLKLLQAIGDLGRFSLVQRDVNKKVFSIHRLVQEVTIDLTDSDTQSLWAKRCVCAVAAVFPYVIEENFSLCEQLLPHVRAISKYILKFDIKTKEAARIFNQAAIYYKEQAQYKEAEEFYNQALVIDEALYGLEHEGVAAVKHNLGVLYAKQGRFSEAAPILEQSLSVSKRVFGINHPEVATTIESIARLHVDLGKYAEAEEEYKLSLEIRVRLYGSSHSLVASGILSLANLYTKQGLLSKSEEYYSKAANIVRNLYGSNHFEMASLLGSLGNLYSEQGKFAQAEEVLNEALNITEKSFGKYNHKTANICNNLALLYSLQGKYTDAEALFKSVLTTHEQFYGKNHPSLVNSLTSVGAIHIEQGKYKEGEETLNRAINIIELTLGSSHPELARVLNRLATSYARQRQQEIAIKYFSKAINIVETAFGSDHKDVAAYLNNLASYYYESGMYDEAEPLYVRCKSIIEKTLGNDNAHLVVILNNLAGVYKEQKKYSQAIKLLNRAIFICEREFGSEHHHLASVLNALAVCYQRQNRDEDAISTYKRTIEIMHRLGMASHPNMAKTLINFADIYIKKNDLDEAVRMLEDALSISEQAYLSDYDDIDIANNLKMLAEVYISLGRMDSVEVLITRALKMYERLFGRNSNMVAKCYNLLAQYYQLRKFYKDAERSFFIAKEIMEIAEGKTDFAYTINLIALLYAEQNKFEKAEQFAKQSIKVYEICDGELSLYIYPVLFNLTCWLYFQGKLGEAEITLERLKRIDKKSFYENIETRLIPDFKYILDYAFQQHDYIAAVLFAKNLISISIIVYGSIHKETYESLQKLSGALKLLNMNYSVNKVDVLSKKLAAYVNEPKKIFYL